MATSGRAARFPGHAYPQLIPEPEEIRPGRPAPWAHLEPTRRRGLSVERVLSALSRAGRDVAPNPAGLAREVGEERASLVARSSAVLVALFDEDGEAHVVLTRRSVALRRHRGEVALPGGVMDEGEDAVATALREAREEVGLASELVEPRAWLRPLVSVGSASAIWPVVGRLGSRPDLVAQPSEVERVFTVALADLVSEGAYLEERWRRDRPGVDEEGFLPIFFYRVPGEVIWGATARILTELLSLTLEVPWDELGRHEI